MMLLKNFNFFDLDVRGWHGCEAQVLGSSNHARPKCLGSGKSCQTHAAGATNHARPVCLGLANMSDLTNNKQKGQLYTLVVKRERKKEKNTNNQSLAAIQPLYVHTRHNMGKEHGCASS
jgi:hypothetical protein